MLHMYINVYIYKNIGHVVLNFYICTYGFEINFGVTNVYICKNIGHVLLNVYICTYGFERKIWCHQELNCSMKVLVYSYLSKNCKRYIICFDGLVLTLKFNPFPLHDLVCNIDILD